MFEISDAKLRPTIGENESIVGVHGFTIDALDANVLCIVTTSRLCFRERVGETIPDGRQSLQSLDVPLDAISVVRIDTGFLGGHIEIEHDGQLLTLSDLTAIRVKQFVSSLEETGTFTPREDDDASESSRLVQAVQGLGYTASLVMAVLGLLIAVMGVGVSLTIIGAIVGIPLIALGTGLASIGLGGTGAIPFGKSHSEWIHVSESDGSIWE